MDKTIDINNLDSTMCKELLRQLLEQGTVQYTSSDIASNQNKDTPPVKKQKMDNPQNSALTTSGLQPGTPNSKDGQLLESISAPQPGTSTSKDVPLVVLQNLDISNSCLEQSLPPQMANSVVASQGHKIDTIECTECTLPDTYITMRHGHVLINTKFLANVQKDHGIYFSLTDIANSCSVGLPLPTVHVVPSLPCCNIVRLLHPTCAISDLFFRLQVEIVKFCSTHPNIPQYHQ